MRYPIGARGELLGPLENIIEASSVKWFGEAWPRKDRIPTKFAEQVLLSRVVGDFGRENSAPNGRLRAGWQALAPSLERHRRR